MSEKLNLTTTDDCLTEIEVQGFTSEFNLSDGHSQFITEKIYREVSIQ